MTIIEALGLFKNGPKRRRANVKVGFDVTTTPLYFLVRYHTFAVMKHNNYFEINQILSF